MPDRGLFYTYYDALFSTKDYAGEVAAVMTFCTDTGVAPLTRILEVGCGTGNHTLELARQPGVRVTAVDPDREMLALAQAKVRSAGVTNVAFVPSLAGGKGADLCVAFFNVVNYVTDDGGLERFFADIAGQLRPGGVLVFDCWNGSAVLNDPPGSKSYERQIDGHTLRCQLTTVMDRVRRLAKLCYQLALTDRDGRETATELHTIAHRLWTPDELREAVAGAEFGSVNVNPPFDFSRPAGAGEWKIMFVCRKG